MGKKAIIVCLVACLSVLFAVSGMASATNKDDAFRLAGLYFNSAHDNKARDTTIIASYNGHNITADIIEYQRKMNVIRSTETAKEYNTDIDVANRIIENIIIEEEAEKMGLTATDTEIEEMVANAIRAYSIPEGKAAMDAYCEGAGITLDKYLELLREQAPRVIARQKLKDAVGKQYCEENGLTFTKVNPPKEMLQAQDAYIEELFEKHKADIAYYIEQ